MTAIAERSIRDTEVEALKLTVETSTGAKIEVWRDKNLFHARRTDQEGGPQTCWAADLFEVIAELAHLDLDDEPQAAEAMRLATRAHRALHPE